MIGESVNIPKWMGVVGLSPGAHEAMCPVATMVTVTVCPTVGTNAAAAHGLPQ